MCSSSVLRPRFYLPACIALLSLMGITEVKAQDSTGVNIQHRGKYAFVLYAGGGWFYYTGPVGAPALGSTTSIIHSHPIGTLRIMWHPDHRLRVGLETGYTNFYTYSIKANNTPGKVNLTAVPVLLVWSMAITPRFNIFAGAGLYLLTTNLDYQGKLASRATSLGLNISANYVQPVSRKFGLGAELKWTDASQTRDYGWSGHLLLVWKMLEW